MAAAAHSQTMTITVPETDRALATIETIIGIAPIAGADAIERARVRGWDVVVGRDHFQVGDQVIYIEVDSFLPITDPRFAFLIPRGVRTDETGNAGHVVKTARLRGQYSQGIIFELTDFPELTNITVGDDVTQQLNITKWDPPLPSELIAQARLASLLDSCQLRRAGAELRRCPQHQQREKQLARD